MYRAHCAVIFAIAQLSCTNERSSVYSVHKAESECRCGDGISLPSLVFAGDEQYNTGHDEDDSAPESCAHAAPGNHPVCRLQPTQ